MLGKTIPSESTTLLDRRGHVEIVFSSTLDNALFRVDNDFMGTAELGRGGCSNEEASLFAMFLGNGSHFWKPRIGGLTGNE
jgi:hypothetical protein